MQTSVDVSGVEQFSNLFKIKVKLHTAVLAHICGASYTWWL
jgi:hypothetical protein